MFALFLIITRWLVKRILWLVAISAVLWVGWQIEHQLATLKAMEESVHYLEQGAKSLVEDIHQQGAKAELSAKQLKSATYQKLNDRIAELSRQIDIKRASLKQIDSIINRINPAKILDSAKLRAEIEIDSQELAYLIQVKSIHVNANMAMQVASACGAIRQKHVDAYALYERTHANLKKAKVEAGPLEQWISFSDGYKRIQSLENERTNQIEQTRLLKREHDGCLAKQHDFQQASLKAKNIQQFAFNKFRTEAIINELLVNTQTIREKVQNLLIKQFLTDPLKKVLPAASAILAFAIVIPIIIKLCMFFVLAPIASRRPPIRLLLGRTSHYTMQEPGQSAVSISVSLTAEMQLLIKPAYFHSAPEYCKTVSKIGLNSHFLFTSFAAEMNNLTQVRCDKPANVTVSAGHDTFNELAIVKLAEGEAVSIRPRNLIGVIHQKNKPVSLTSHWKLGSLQAWLSMQLRHIVFHGPAEILVRGCRGVRVENVALGRVIDQGSTIGFSANLENSVCRTETFMAYFTGEKGLLRDRFSGASGFYIYEEMPNSGEKPGVKRGVEGLTDSILKVLGI